MTERKSPGEVETNKHDLPTPNTGVRKSPSEGVLRASFPPGSRHLVTFFKTATAKTKTEEYLTLEELADRIRSASANTKKKLPWLKLAQFGEGLSSGGSLRHDANVQKASGGEIDYDGEIVPLAEAELRLKNAGVEALLYASPSNTVDKPRWRVLFFFSRLAAPEQRAIYVKAVNEILGGIAASESLTLSQSYYYGRVDGGPEVDVRITKGSCVDLLVETNPFIKHGEEIARGALKKPVDVDARLAAMAYKASADENRVHDTQLAVTASLIRRGIPVDDVVQQVIEATKAVAPDGWDWPKEERDIRKMCEKPLQWLEEGRTAQALALDDRIDLIRQKSGAPKPLFANVVSILKGHKEWADVIVYDEFAMQIVAQNAPPWSTSTARWQRRPWTDHDDLETLGWLQQTMRIDASKNTVADAVDLVASQNKQHPVRQYLYRLCWDGVPRLDKWTIDYLGAEDSEYSRAVSSKVLISAVARVRKPGCKVDTMMILEGHQGALKSTAIRMMFVPWFTDDIAEFGSKDAAMQMQGRWCIEVSELDAMSKGEASKVKSFMSRQEDRFRPPYGRRVVESPRQSILMGTSNKYEYLKDETGARRYWPLKIGKIDINGLKATRDQLFAEADVRFNQGEVWWLEGDQVRLAEMEQSARYVEDAWTNPICHYLEDIEETTSVDEIMVFLGIMEVDQNRGHQNRIGSILTRNGWERFYAPVGNGKRAWRYRRIDDSAPSSGGFSAQKAFLAYARRIERFTKTGIF